MAKLKLPAKKPTQSLPIVTVDKSGTEIDTATGEPSNNQRARWAFVGVTAFAAAKGGDLDESDLSTEVFDLIVDLAHLLRGLGEDPAQRLQQAIDMHGAEEAPDATPADEFWMGAFK